MSTLVAFRNPRARARLAICIALATASIASAVQASPTPFSANPNPVTICAPLTTGSTTISWDVTGQISDEAILKVDYGSGVYQTLGPVFGKSSATETVIYGHPNFFALFSTQTDKAIVTIRVDVVQVNCPPGGGGPPPSKTLLPTKMLSSYHRDERWATGLCTDFGGPPFFFGPSINVGTLSGNIAAGFQHQYTSGPCWSQDDEFYRGGVGFDMNFVNTFALAHGLKSASLLFRQDTGSLPCIDHIDINSDPWEGLVPGTVDVLPSGAPTLYPMMAPAKGGGFWGQANVTAPIALGVALGGLSPHLHFVFIGRNEDPNAQDNDGCLSTISMLVLELVGAH